MTTINADGYLSFLENYLFLSQDDKKGKNGPTPYGILCKEKEKEGLSSSEIMLADTDGATKERLRAKLSYSGKIVAIRLDAYQDRFFHFLHNDGHAWSRRCDFVLFQSVNNTLNAYCIEFKKARSYIPVTDVALQLSAGEAWCCTLHRLILSYVGKEAPITLSKFVFTDCANPHPDLDTAGKYLKKHPDIRHYTFSEVSGLALESLDNTCRRTIP